MGKDVNSDQALKLAGVTGRVLKGLKSRWETAVAAEDVRCRTR